jgi:hypothetical protein
MAVRSRTTTGWPTSGPGACGGRASRIILSAAASGHTAVTLAVQELGLDSWALAWAKRSIRHVLCTQTSNGCREIV